MPILQLVADGGEQVAGPLRICNLHLGDEVDVLPAPSHLPEVHPRECGTDQQENPMAERTLEQQIEFIAELAKRQFPDDESGQLHYRLELTTQKLREYASKFTKVEVRTM